VDHRRKRWHGPFDVSPQIERKSGFGGIDWTRILDRRQSRPAISEENRQTDWNLQGIPKRNGMRSIRNQHVTLGHGAKVRTTGPVVHEQAVAGPADADKRPFRPIEEMAMGAVDLNATEIAALCR
jgi:hypothetical protein